MAQGTLKYEYEKDESKSGMTSLGGLPVYMDFAVSSGSIDSQGQCVLDLDVSATAESRWWNWHIKAK